MGWYFRKSASYGPFRFNFSKSGIGVSTGVKGFRVSTGPRGTYLNAGSNGLYYRSKLGPSKKARNGMFRTKQLPHPTTGATANNSAITGTDTLTNLNPNIAKVYDQKMMRIVSDRAQRAIAFRWLFGTAIFISFCLVGKNPNFMFIFLGLIICRFSFPSLFTVYGKYNMDEDAEISWKELNDALINLNKSDKIWIVETSEAVYDRKKLAGAATTVTRHEIRDFKLIKSYSHNSVKIRTDVPIVQLKYKHHVIVFFPNMILVKHNTRIDEYSYENMRSNITFTRFIEKNRSVPKDATVIGHTWQYVNKDGSPDSRFKGNYQLPVCKYGEITFIADSGFSIVIEASNISLMEKLCTAFNNYQKHLEEISNGFEANNEISRLQALDETPETNSNNNELLPSESSGLLEDINKYFDLKE